MEVTYRLNLLKDEDLLKYKQFTNCESMANTITDFEEKIRQLEKNDTKNTKYTIEEVIEMFWATLLDNGLTLDDVKTDKPFVLS